MTSTLTIVVPVHNEAALVGDVVDEWVRELAGVDVACELVLYDDGSTDATPNILEALAARHPSVIVRRHANRGHGPTVLRGYRDARGEWVFQADSDGEIDVTAFRTLWDQRSAHDFVVGRRVGRASPWTRRLISAASSLTVRLLFGPGIHDVNCPFRLMRTDRLRELLAEVPDDAFAPNVMLSGLAVARGLRVIELPVRCVQRRRDTGSLGGLKALRMAARSLGQTVNVALASRSGRSR